MRPLTRVMLCVAAAAPVAGRPAAAQGRFPPDSFTNLKVLSKTIDQRTLIATMRGFALALGVRCTYCHVGPEGAPLDSLSFAKDDKRTQKVASVIIPAALGDVLLQKGATVNAIASYRTALVRDSTFLPARMRLRQLTGGGQTPPRP